MSGSLILRKRPSTRHEYRVHVGALFAVHRRVVVRRDPAAWLADGPEFCTCGDVWPCRSEDEAARILDWD